MLKEKSKIEDMRVALALGKMTPSRLNACTLLSLRSGLCGLWGFVLISHDRPWMAPLIQSKGLGCQPYRPWGFYRVAEYGVLHMSSFFPIHLTDSTGRGSDFVTTRVRACARRGVRLLTVLSARHETSWITCLTSIIQSKQNQNMPRRPVAKSLSFSCSCSCSEYCEFDLLF